MKNTVKDYLDSKDYPVGLGWHGILNELFSQLPGDYQVQQIKEKFGGLRVYMEGDGEDYISNLIRKAEEQSFKTCEECGNEGKTSAFMGWYLTLCEQHTKERQDFIEKMRQE